MSGPARIAAFAVLLVAVFAGAALLGGAVDPSGSDADRVDDAGHSEDEAQPTAGHAGGGHAEDPPAEAAPAPPGLGVADGRYRLVVDRDRFSTARRRTALAFRIVDPSGRPVRRFELEHEKRMHFIVVRRDLSGFQHVHPTMGPDGTWTSRVDLRTGGVHRLFADFKHGGAKRTLGADVHVGGGYRPKAPRSPRSTARTEDGLEVSVRSGQTNAGEEARVEFEVRDRGRLVNDRLQPYLGAAGHLVVLRAGDLAYLHTHAEDDELAFVAEYPSAGSYRLFAQFRYQGQVRTAAFTQEVAP